MEVNVSSQLSDPRWDIFLQQIPRSHYLQSSLWTQVNQKFGWRCVRATVEQDGQIVAGFQMLLRSMPFLGNIGYVPRGPVLAEDDPSLVELIVQQLYRVARSEKAILFKVQPPYNGAALAEYLSQEKFWPSHSHADNVATVLIDLTLDETQLMNNMKKSLRKGIRRAERKGVAIRQGTEQDLSAFFRILQHTSQRGDFAIHSEAYYREIWQKFAPADRAALFVAECEGEAVAALLLILFGNTAFARFGGWNGRYAKYEPNSLLRWTAICWAKAHGYSWYDFMGIDEKLARAVLQGQATHDLKEVGGYTAFKLGFGGQIALSPGTYDYVQPPLLAKSFRWLQARPTLYNWLLNLVRGARHIG